MQKFSPALTLVLLLCGAQLAAESENAQAAPSRGPAAPGGATQTGAASLSASPTPVDRGRALNPVPSWAWGWLLAIGFLVAAGWCFTSVVEALARKAQMETEQRQSPLRDLIKIVSADAAKSQTQTALETLAQRLEGVAEKTTDAADRVQKSLGTADRTLADLASSLERLERRVDALKRPAAGASGSARGQSEDQK